MEFTNKGDQTMNPSETVITSMICTVLQIHSDNEFVITKPKMNKILVEIGKDSFMLTIKEIKQ